MYAYCIYLNYYDMKRFASRQTEQHEARQDRKRQYEAAPKQEVVAWFWKMLYMLK